MTKKKTTAAKQETKQAAPQVDLKKIFKAASDRTNAEAASAILQKFPPGQHTGNIFSALANHQPDIRGLLHYLAATYQPKAYLEIGVRLGYSMAMVAKASPQASIVGVDSWLNNYGGEANGNPAIVEDSLRALGCKNKLQFLSEGSHTILPLRFAAYPDESFDLILIDGDNTIAGALQDMRDTLPHLSKGGFLVLDDLNVLVGAWEAIQAEFPELEYHSEGIVGLAYRKG